VIAVFLRNSYKRYGCDLFYTIDLKVFRTDWILREQLVPSLTYLAYTNVTNTAISAARDLAQERRRAASREGRRRNDMVELVRRWPLKMKLQKKDGPAHSPLSTSLHVTRTSFFRTPMQGRNCLSLHFALFPRRSMYSYTLDRLSTTTL
jgi:hypothetical protein